MSLVPFRFASFPPEVSHGVTTRATNLPAEGDLSFVTGPSPDAVWENRVAWCAAIGVDPARLTCAQQVHGAAVRLVEAGDAGRGAHSFADAIPGTDALVTATPGLPIAVFCADCVPILLYDPRHRVVAAVHAGWRGTVANVAGRAVATMRERFGTQPIELLAGIGPSIGPCCYEVGEEVESAWAAAGVDPDGVALRGESTSLRFNLWRANALALQAAGVREERIEIAAVCTACHVDRFFSHRAERGRTGRFAAIIAVDAR